MRERDSASHSKSNRVIAIKGQGTTTAEHPFWSETHHEFRPAHQSEPGAVFVGPNGERQTLTSNTCEAQPQGVLVYNFSVDAAHTYFVSCEKDSTPLLVHNADYAPSSKQPRFDGRKPVYSVNPTHAPGTLRRGKTPLPSDAEEVFRRAVPDDPVNPRHWYGQNANGQIYRLSGGNDGTAHFSGIDGIGDGIRNITEYARQRLAELGR